MSFWQKLKHYFSNPSSHQDALILYAPITGKAINLSEVPDPVFAEKVVGEGIAIQPTGHLVLAPTQGKLEKIFKTNHAFSLITEQGIELLVHVGIDTVELEGKGFKRLAQEGQTIRLGEPILELDLAYLTTHAKSLITPVIITNGERIHALQTHLGAVIAATSPILSFQLNG